MYIFKYLTRLMFTAVHSMPLALAPVENLELLANSTKENQDSGGFVFHMNNNMGDCFATRSRQLH